MHTAEIGLIAARQAPEGIRGRTDAWRLVNHSRANGLSGAPQAEASLMVRAAAFMAYRRRNKDALLRVV